MKHPDWIKTKLILNSDVKKINEILSRYKLNTVCFHAHCPHIGECYSKKHITFMILGTGCTRNCTYCNVEHNTGQPIDRTEAVNIAQAVKILNLTYVVITSVTRDDLDDGGARHFASVIKQIYDLCPGTKVEVLIPDFQGNMDNAATVIHEKPFVIAHNIETTESLFSGLKPQGDYTRSLSLLKEIKKINKMVHTKSGIMIGLGETMQEIIKSLHDLRTCNVDYLTIGQYLSPSAKHAPVKKYYHPDEFAELKEIGYNLGFHHVMSSPLTRSSYHADEVVKI